MFSSLSGQLLDILIGLVFLYAALSVFVSGLGNILAKSLGWRGKMFHAGVDTILRPTNVRPPSIPTRLVRLVGSIFRPGGPVRSAGVWLMGFLRRRPASDPAANESEDEDQEEPATDPRDLTRAEVAVSSAAHGLVHRFLNHPACQSYVRNRGLFTLFGTGRLSYLPSGLFARVLMDCLIPEGANLSGAITPVDFQRSLDLLPDRDLAASLRVVTQGRTGNTAEIESALGEHFDSVMKEVEGWYARKMSLVTFTLGFIVAFLFNLDTVRFVRDGWNDPVRSKQLADQAAQASARLGVLVQDLEKARASGAADPAEIQATIAQSQELIRELKPRLPVGWNLPDRGAILPEGTPPGEATTAAFRAAWRNVWSHLRKDLADWVHQPVSVAMRWLGLFLTAFAISMQSRFWYDLLQRLLKIRRDQDGEAVRS